VVTIFHLLNKGNKLKLPEIRRLEEIERTNDPNYCLFHKMVHHPTSRCFVLKDKFQALVDAGILTLKSEQRSHCEYGDFQFWDLPEDDSSRWIDPSP